jgi:signal transduction histidine kinase
VRVRYGAAALEVEVLDDGHSRALRPGVHQAGHGLIGMRERATLHGGHLRAGPRPEGGFAVHATFPLNESVPVL